MNRITPNSQTAPSRKLTSLVALPLLAVLSFASAAHAADHAASPDGAQQARPQLAEDTAATSKTAWDLMNKANAFLARGNLLTGHNMFRAAAEVALLEGDDETAATALSAAGATAMIGKWFDTAETVTRQEIALHEKAGRAEMAAVKKVFLARVLMRKTPEEGASAFEALLPELEEGQHYDLLVQAHEELGRILAGRGEQEEAVSHHRQAARAAEKAGNEARQAKQLVFVANLLMQMERYDDARKELLQARDLFEESGKDEQGLHVALGSLALLALQDKEYDKAEDYFTPVAAWHEQAGNLEQAAFALQKMGEIDRIQDDLPGAESRFRKALKMLEGKPLARRIGAARYNLAIVLKQQGRQDEAQEQYDQAITLLGRSVDSAMMAKLKSEFAAARR